MMSKAERKRMDNLIKKYKIKIDKYLYISRKSLEKVEKDFPIRYAFVEELKLEGDEKEKKTLYKVIGKYRLKTGKLQEIIDNNLEKAEKYVLMREALIEAKEIK